MESHPHDVSITKEAKTIWRWGLKDTMSEDWRASFETSQTWQPDKTKQAAASQTTSCWPMDRCIMYCGLTRTVGIWRFCYKTLQKYQQILG